MKVTLRCGHDVETSWLDRRAIEGLEDTCAQCKAERRREEAPKRAPRAEPPPDPVDFTSEVPLIRYTPPCGHTVRLRYDLDETVWDEGEEPEEQYVYCRQCGDYYLYTEYVAKALPNPSGARRLSERDLAQQRDNAIIRNRIAKLLSCEETITREYAQLVADIIGCSVRTVWNVERDMWSYAEWKGADNGRGK